MKKTPFILVMAIFTIALTGCNQPKNAAFDNVTGSTQAVTPVVKNDVPTETTSNSEKTVAPSDTKDSTSDEIALTSKKINYYISCMNSHSERVLSSFDRYLSWADEKTGPTGKEKVIYGLYTIQDPKGCLTGLKTAKDLTPHFAELEKAGDAYAAALEKVEPLLTKANDYYEQSDYKDDAMAKGKEMHAPLIAAFNEFEKANTQLEEQVDKIDDDLAVKTLADLEKTEGRKIAFLTRNAMVLAKKIIRLGNVQDINKINVDNFKKSIDDYDKAVTELTDYVAAHKDEANEHIMMSSFTGDSKEFLTASKELMRRVRDKEEYSTGEKMNLGGPGEWMVDGSPGKLLNKYNELIQTSNNFGSL